MSSVCILDPIKYQKKNINVFLCQILWLNYFQCCHHSYRKWITKGIRSISRPNACGQDGDFSRTVCQILRSGGGVKWWSRHPVSKREVRKSPIQSKEFCRSEPLYLRFKYCVVLILPICPLKMKVIFTLHSLFTTAWVNIQRNREENIIKIVQIDPFFTAQIGSVPTVRPEIGWKIGLRGEWNPIHSKVGHS